jgi:hypothetical protein
VPDEPVVLLPGKTVTTATPSITVAPMREPGIYLFVLTVADESGLVGSGQITVTVRPG